MTIQNIVTALPGGSAPVDQALLRAALLSGLGHFIEPDTDPQTVDPVDAGSGAFPWLVFWHETLWWFDPDDTTTAHDGTSCIVLDNGGRYKVSTIDPWYGYSVLSASTMDPPDPEDEVEEDRPDFGDAYIVPSGASGEWGDHADEIAIWTARGWGYIPPRRGRLVEVEDEDAYRHWMGTEWELGLGNSTFVDASIAPRHLIQGVTAWIVEEVGTNTPPTIAKGVNYIVGGSPTGDFAGHTNKIATSDDGLEWDFNTPSEGWEVYDRDTNLKYRYDGTTWQSVALAYAGVQVEFTSGSTAFTAQGSNNQGYAPSTTAPTQSQNARFELTPTATIQADYVGQKFEVEFSATITAASIATNAGGFVLTCTLAAFIDSVANAVDWGTISFSGETVDSILTYPANCHGREIRGSFEFSLGDTSSHTLKLFLLPRISSNLITAASTSITLIRRRLTVRKKS